jgi:hypothetical protein
MVIVFTVKGIFMNRVLQYIGIKITIIISIISILVIRLASAINEFIATPSRFIKQVQNKLNIGKYSLFNYWFYRVDDTRSIDRQEFCDKFTEICESLRIQIPTQEILPKLDNMCICAFIILISTFSCSPDLVFNALGIDNNILKQFEIKTFMEYNTLLYVLKKYLVFSQLQHINGKLIVEEHNACMAVYSDKKAICIVGQSPNNKVQTTVKLLVDTITFNIVDIIEIENDLYNRGYNKIILKYIAYWSAYYKIFYRSKSVHNTQMSQLEQLESLGAIRKDVQINIFSKDNIYSPFSTEFQYDSLKLTIDGKTFEIRGCSRYCDGKGGGIDYHLKDSPPNSLYCTGSEYPSDGEVIELIATIDYSKRGYVIEELDVEETRVPHWGQSRYRNYSGYSLVLYLNPDSTIEPSVALRFQANTNILVMH